VVTRPALAQPSHTGSTDTQCKWTRAKKALKDVLCKPLLELILDLLPKDPLAIRMRFQPILKEDRAAIERGISPDGDEVYSTMFDIFIFADGTGIRK
jgi:hypothetical protein